MTKGLVLIKDGDSSSKHKSSHKEKMKHRNIGLVPNMVSLISQGGDSFASNGHFSSNGISIKIPYGGMLYYINQLCTHFSLTGQLELSLYHKISETQLRDINAGIAATIVTDANTYYFLTFSDLTLKIEDYTYLFIRKLLCVELWPLHASSGLLLIWHVVTKLNSRCVVICHHTRNDMK